MAAITGTAGAPAGDMLPGRLALSTCAAVLVTATTAAPSLAATPTAYTAAFPRERTVQRTCPAAVPAGSFCFTGTDHSGLGTSVPGGAPATEDFAGFVDFSHPIANACVGSTSGFPDHNVVTIGTPSGQLFLRTDGTDCTSTGTDDGTWQVLGGTGVFNQAAGSGHVHTQSTGGTGTPTDPITSFSAYMGTLTFR
jgi:hypothetical protein